MLASGNALAQTVFYTGTTDGGGWPWWAWFLLALFSLCAFGSAIGCIVATHKMTQRKKVNAVPMASVRVPMQVPMATATVPVGARPPSTVQYARPPMATATVPIASATRPVTTVPTASSHVPRVATLTGANPAVRTVPMAATTTVRR